MSKSRRNNLIVQGSILAIAGIIVRIIGLFYRIPLLNILTNEGNGYYSAGYTIYSYLLIISSYGFPAAISKIVSKELSQHKYREAHRIFKSSMILSIIIGVFFSGVLIAGSGVFASFIGVPNAKYAIMALAPALLIFSVMSVLRGYFQGMNTMVPTAMSQIIEQVFNAIFSIVFAYLLLGKGYPVAAAGSSLGTSSGALFGCVFLMFVFMVLRPTINEKISKDIHKNHKSSIFYYWKILLMTSIPMVIGTSTFHLTGLVDLIMFSRGLIYHGYSEKQIAIMNGLLDGKYKIIITVPVAVISSLSTSIIPSITKVKARNDKKGIEQQIKIAYRSTAIVTIPAAIGIATLARPIQELLFTDTSYIEITTLMLQMGAFSIILFGFSTISIGLLQGLDHLTIPVKHSFVALIVKAAFNILFLFVLNFNLYGAVITNIIFAGTSAFLNYRTIKQKYKFKLEVYKFLIAPLIASFAMGGITLISYKLIGIVVPQKITTLLAILIAGLVYVFTLLNLKAFSKKEIEDIPGLKKLSRFVKE